MGNRLKGKVSVVTTCGGGVGVEVALLLAEEGSSVVVNDPGVEANGTGSSQKLADQVVEEVKRGGGNAVASYENVALMEGGEKVVQKAIDTFGRLDVLVNDTSVLRDRPIEEMTLEDFRHVIRNNVRSTFTPTKFAAILFRQQQSGRIVNMTSDAGLGTTGQSNYAASSEAIVGLTRAVARDLGRYGVTCNAISTSVATKLSRDVDTNWPQAQNLYPQIEQKPKADFEPTTMQWDGPGSPDDPGNVAPLAVYLCTYASPNINGNVFGVRGGSIHLYSNPTVERSIHKWGPFTLDEIDVLAPKMFGNG